MRNLFALAVLMLSIFGSGASHAAYCVQVSSSGVLHYVDGYAAAVNYVISASQPGDKTTCSQLLLSGSELASLYSSANAVTALNTQVTNLQNLITTMEADIVALQSQSGGGGGTSEPFDADLAASIFSFFFLGIVGLFLFSKNVGLILEAIKKW